MKEYLSSSQFVDYYPVGGTMPSPSIADLVDHLFKTRRRPDGKEYTYQEISDALGGELEPSHLAKIRKGKIPNPSWKTLRHLCLFFQVPAAYFFPDLEAIAPPSEEMETQDCIALALRSAGLPPDVQA